MNSVWWDDVESVQFDALSGNKKVDVLIVGGGAAGILCAHALENAGVNYALIEADRICSGITKNTTAKITFCHGLIYDKLIGRFGEKYTRLYLDAQLSACREYQRLCREISCDYEKKDSYVYSRNDLKSVKNEIAALNRLGINAELSNAERLPFSVSGAVRVKNQAQFSPLKFFYALSQRLNIYETTKAVQFLPKKVITDKGEISYNKLIIATHFPILNKHGLYPLKLYQHRSYVIAMKNADDVDGIYVDALDKGMSFRNYKDLLLLGGGGHRTGKKGGGWGELENMANKYYKNAEIIGRWASQDCMTLDGAPYIGKYSKRLPNVFVATGFNKWGMTNSMVAANILCDMVREKENPYEPVFSPSRSVIRPQLAVNAFESVLGLITPTSPRCPHLGCALKYNAAEHSWDCPCHGSRFTEEGELIDNPATDDKRK